MSQAPGASSQAGRSVANLRVVCDRDATFRACLSSGVPAAMCPGVATADLLQPHLSGILAPGTGTTSITGTISSTWCKYPRQVGLEELCSGPTWTHCCWQLKGAAVVGDRHGVSRSAAATGAAALDKGCKVKRPVCSQGEGMM